jgi:KipI family sensor histidine kinase inhibitor
MSPAPRFLVAGDRALVVEYGDAIDPDINARVRGLAVLLEQAALDGVIELVPTYRSLMIHYDQRRLAADALERHVREADSRLGSVTLPPPRIVEVPTVYGGEAGPDLDDVAARAGLSTDQVVALHAGTDYLVYMMGFMPGFPYLGGMSARIATPRLGTPRTVVPAGSVGIAGAQTGIYPTESPGGWRLIGRTTLRLFDVARVPPALVEAGDRVRFVPMTRAGSAMANTRETVDRESRASCARRARHARRAGHHRRRRRDAQHDPGSRPGGFATVRRPRGRRHGRMGAARREPAGRERGRDGGARDHAGRAHADVRR